MSIIVKDRLFTLETAQTSYQMQVGAFEHLLHLYYGAKIPAEDTSYLLENTFRHFSPYPHGGTIAEPSSLDILPQELPTLGTGDLRTPALVIENADGTKTVDLTYQSYEILPGKYDLAGMPSFFAGADDNVETLKITLADNFSKVEVDLLYGVFPEKDIITRSTIVRNAGEQSLKILRAQSLNLDFISGDFDLIHFQGRWTMERQFERLPLSHTTMNFGSNYGISSPKQNPGFILASPDTTETSGEAYGFNLVYSGNFTATAEQSIIGQTRVTLGLGDNQFAWTLPAGESFTSPEAVLSYSDSGLGKLSQQFHKAIRENLQRSKFTKTQRPVLINNWEATYFDFNGEKLIALAETAKEIGVALLVMDDGWFGNRFDDNRALGDWFVNEEKLGMTLGELTEQVNAKGLKFGIWFEPEMVNEDSDLYRAQPDWALTIPGRQPVLGRNQLVLDLSKKEVVDYLFERLSSILDSANIEYVKWDMNRPITDWTSSEQQHRYVLGLYKLLGGLTEKYPQILFEGCSSGGARFDLAMLAYQPQIWTSDNNDAINRLKIQYGTSFFYPVSSMGAHVAAVPGHQNGRTTPFATRAAVAMAGTYGYELDVTSMSAEEKAEAAAFSQRYKAHQELIYSGDYYRLASPFEGKLSAWQIVAKDRSASLVTLVSTDVEGNAPYIYLKLRGLEAEAHYKIDGKSYSGALLMRAGYRFDIPNGDYPAQQIVLEKI